MTPDDRDTYFREGYLLHRAIAVHYASAHCSDIWDGETTFVKGYDPRLDYRLVRGSDPNGYVKVS